MSVYHLPSAMRFIAALQLTEYLTSNNFKLECKHHWFWKKKNQLRFKGLHVVSHQPKLCTFHEMQVFPAAAHAASRNSWDTRLLKKQNNFKVTETCSILNYGHSLI
ncbi:hypothetical protein ILYODFUR_034744 [Ilyodon furcidens]|uniref:Uncharacterized protein n=1 Tax=Ilyodon furcidens TaxID=33524 RepID=A0ABV0UZH2_9TELE